MALTLVTSFLIKETRPFGLAPRNLKSGTAVSTWKLTCKALTKDFIEFVPRTFDPVSAYSLSSMWLVVTLDQPVAERYDTLLSTVIVGGNKQVVVDGILVNFQELGSVESVLVPVRKFIQLLSPCSNSRKPHLSTCSNSR